MQSYPYRYNRLNFPLARSGKNRHHNPHGIALDDPMKIADFVIACRAISEFDRAPKVDSV
jgi:hypothetical protein